MDGWLFDAVISSSSVSMDTRVVAMGDGEPRTATSIFSQLLSSDVVLTAPEL